MSRPESLGPGFDTHSPAWWRAQALAHEAAAGTEAPSAGAPAPVAESLAPGLPAPAASAPASPAPTPLDADWEPSGPGGFHPAGPDPDTDELHLPAVPPPTAQPAVSVLPGGGGVRLRRSSAPVAATAASYPGFEALPAEREPDQDEPAGRGRALVGAGLALAGVSLGVGVLLWFGGGLGNHAAASRSQTASAHAAGGSQGAATQLPATQLPATQLPATSPAPVRSNAAAPPVVVDPVVVAPVVVPPAAPVRPAVLPLTVLNNSRHAGLADRSAARFRAGGWSTPVVGNFTGRLSATTVYYAPGQGGSAQRFARQFGISRVLPRFAGLPGSGLTVVLTRDYA